MFDFSFPEMVVVFVIALLVLGPERLPKVARTVGQWVGQARNMFGRLRSELEREANFQELQDAQRELRKALDEGSKAVSDSVKPVIDAVEASPPSGSEPPSQEAASDFTAAREAAAAPANDSIERTGTDVRH